MTNLTTTNFIVVCLIYSASQSISLLKKKKVISELQEIPFIFFFKSAYY